jgi:hypothetical protein
VSNSNVHLALLGDVSHHAERLPARLADAFGNLFHVRPDVVGDDRRALAAEAFGDRSANAASGPSHDDDASDETLLLLHRLAAQA